MLTTCQNYRLSSACISDMGKLASHIPIRCDRDVKEKVRLDVICPSLADKPEVEREGIRYASIAAHMEALMVGLRSDIPDAACLPDRPSSKYFMDAIMVPATRINGLVQSTFKSYNPRHKLSRTIVEEAKGEGT